MLNPLIAMPGGAEWFIILAIVILIFGASKLPDLARGTGQALRIFKSETKGLRDDDEDDETTAPPPPPVATELPPTPPVTPVQPVQPVQPVVEDRQADQNNG